MLSCILMNNQECKVRPQIVNVNSDGPMLFGSFNNINNPYVKLCVPHVGKNINIKVFNILPRTDEARHIEWHETCKCKCRLAASVCNNKQRWNKDKCRCEFKELIDKWTCHKGFIWNPSICECECSKSCDVEEYLDYEIVNEEKS